MDGVQGGSCNPRTELHFPLESVASCSSSSLVHLRGRKGECTQFPHFWTCLWDFSSQATAPGILLCHITACTPTGLGHYSMGLESEAWIPWTWPLFAGVFHWNRKDSSALWLQFCTISTSNHPTYVILLSHITFSLLSQLFPFRDLLTAVIAECNVHRVTILPLFLGICLLVLALCPGKKFQCPPFLCEQAAHSLLAIKFR